MAIATSPPAASPGPAPLAGVVPHRPLGAAHATDAAPACVSTPNTQAYRTPIDATQPSDAARTAHDSNHSVFVSVEAYDGTATPRGSLTKQPQQPRKSSRITFAEP